MPKFFLMATLVLSSLTQWSREATLQAQSTSSPIVGQIVDSVRLRGIEDVHLEGEYAFLPCREGKRFTICSIKDPAHPQVVSSFTHPLLGSTAGFDMEGDIVYLASQDNCRLLTVDVSDKSAPAFLGSIPICSSGKGVLYKVLYRDGFCYVANLTGKSLVIVDVHNPSQPVIVKSVEVTKDNDGPFSITLLGDYALVGTIFGSRNRLAVVNVQDPAEARLVTQVFGPEVGHTSGEVVDRYFFSVNWDKNAFLVFDVSNPSAPELKAKLVDKRLGNPNRCIVVGDRAYLPMVTGHGVVVVDISEPEAPKYLTSFLDAPMKKTYGIADRDNLLFVGSREGNSLVILNRNALEK